MEASRPWVTGTHYAPALSVLLGMRLRCSRCGYMAYADVYLSVSNGLSRFFSRSYLLRKLFSTQTWVGGSLDPKNNGFPLLQICCCEEEIHVGAEGVERKREPVPRRSKHDQFAYGDEILQSQGR